MASASKKPALQIIRQLISEMKRSTPNKNVKNSQVYQYVISECRKYKTTDEQLCKATEEMNYLAHTYVCYLRSKRMYNDINVEYSGKGERTIAETAALVGFKLPHDPK